MVSDFVDIYKLFFITKWHFVSKFDTDTDNRNISKNKKVSARHTLFCGLCSFSVCFSLSTKHVFHDYHSWLHLPWQGLYVIDVSSIKIAGTASELRCLKSAFSAILNGSCPYISTDMSIHLLNSEELPFTVYSKVSYPSEILYILK